jgi:hypothetical protein
MNGRDAGMLLMVVAALMLERPAGVHAITRIERSVIAEGGRRAAGGGRILVGTVGQATIGMSAGSARMLNAGFWCSAPGAVTSVQDSEPSMKLAFAAPAPNPAADVVRFSVSLPLRGEVDLAVYDLAGRLIRTVANQALGVGRHSWTWDLHDDAGRRAPAGIYFSRLVVNNRVVGNHKFVVLH